MNRFRLFLIPLLVINFVCCAAYTDVLVGIISGPNDDSRQNNRRFWSTNDTRVTLQPTVEDIPWWGSRQVTKAVCSLLRTGVHVMVSAAPRREYRVLESYSSKFNLPMIATRVPKESASTTGYQLSMTPDSAKAAADLIKHYEWTSLVYFYDNDHGPSLLENILEALDHRIEVKAMWRVTRSLEAQRFIQWLPAQEETEGVLLSAKEHLLDEIVATLAHGTGLRRRFHFILADPVGIVNDGGRYEAQGSFVITKLSLGSSKNPGYLDLENRWNTLQPFRRRAPISKVIPSSALLMRDAADVLTAAFRSIRLDYASFNMTLRGVDCLERQFAHTQSYATDLTKSLKKISLPHGMTGSIHFTPTGERDDYSFEVSETSPLRIKKIGTWSKRLGLRIDQSNGESSTLPRPEKFTAIRPKYIVTSVLTPPYLMLNNATTDVVLSGNKRYRGFIVDLMDALCDNLGCDYQLRIVRDGYYGIKKVQDGVEYWNGMIGEVIRQEADMAVAPLTITRQREEVIDFTKPFMNMGLTILIKKPENILGSAHIGALGFLTVWSYQVWLLVLLAYVGFGAANYAISLFTGEPERIRSLDTKLSDRLSVSSSFWFTLALLTFRGTGIYPRSVSHRLLSILWGVFSLVCLAFYVSSLASLLIRARTTTQTTHSLMRSYDVLQSFIEKGYPEVGITAGGSTHRFFNDSNVGLYRAYGQHLQKHPELMVKSYPEGFQRVRSSGGSYAVVMESTGAEYFSNTEPCDTLVTAGYLDQKAFGLGFKKGSLLRDTFDHALLELTEMGVLRNLYEKWWHHEKHGSKCEDPSMDMLKSVYSNALTLEEVSGVFYMLVLGTVIAVSIAFFEHFRRSSKLSVDN